MTVTDLLPAELEEETDGCEDDWDHYYCPKDPDIAYCGADISDAPIIANDAPMAHECPLCAVLMDAAGEVCAKCNRRFEDHL